MSDHMNAHLHPDGSTQYHDHTPATDEFVGHDPEFTGDRTTQEYMDELRGEGPAAEPEPCGCRVAFEATGVLHKSPYRIIYCDLHAAAEQNHRLAEQNHRLYLDARALAEARLDTIADLLAALREADRELTIPIADADDALALDRVRREAITIIRAAIAQAKVETMSDTVKAPERVYREVAPNVFEDITYGAQAKGEEKPIDQRSYAVGWRDAMAQVGPLPKRPSRRYRKMSELWLGILSGVALFLAVLGR